MAQLGELGYESFVETDDGFEAYIPQSAYVAEALESLEPMIEGIGYTYVAEEVPDRDWNEEWEKNYFQPIIIDDKCLVRSTFHSVEGSYPYEIIINPKMSFGTGHHATTCLMMRGLLAKNLSGKCVLDMGCGTGILGILACKRGAAVVEGIDIDQWCLENATENAALNDAQSMKIDVGDARLLEKRTARYDLILANINRNILLSDMEAYATALRDGGELMMSGFYTADAPLITEKALQIGLEPTEQREQDDWMELTFFKC